MAATGMTTAVGMGQLNYRSVANQYEQPFGLEEGLASPRSAKGPGNVTALFSFSLSLKRVKMP